VTEPVPYTIDNAANRDVVDEAAVRARLAVLAGRDDLASRGERVGLLRMTGHLDEAAAEGRAALAVARAAGTPAQQVAAMIRLGHVYQYRHEWAAADELLAEALRMASELDPAVPSLVAFAHQHAGRNHVDQGRLAEAAAAFAAALEIRLAIGAPDDQVESSRGALAHATARLAAGT
jgi:tetratricopeptide (TPR) repeat protein